MVRLGFHLSVDKGIRRTLSDAQKLQCDTFQTFTRNPRGWVKKPIDPKDAENYKFALARSGMKPIVGHMPYLPNLASENSEVHQRSIATLIDELQRCETFEIPYLVTHLGHHGMIDGFKKGKEKVVVAIGQALDATKENKTMILLENTSGRKNTLGGTFTDIGTIADEIGEKDRIGFCFDTCHAGAAGYDIRSWGAEQVFSWFNDEAGALSRLKVIHLNDMKGKVGSRLGQCEHLGLGKLGERAIADVLNYPSIAHCAFIMETPPDGVRSYADDMEVARRLVLKNDEGSESLEEE